MEKFMRGRYLQGSFLMKMMEMTDEIEGEETVKECNVPRRSNYEYTSTTGLWCDLCDKFRAKDDYGVDLHKKLKLIKVNDGYDYSLNMHVRVGGEKGIIVSKKNKGKYAVKFVREVRNVDENDIKVDVNDMRWCLNHTSTSGYGKCMEEGDNRRGCRLDRGCLIKERKMDNEVNKKNEKMWIRGMSMQLNNLYAQAKKKENEKSEEIKRKDDEKKNVDYGSDEEACFD